MSLRTRPCAAIILNVVAAFSGCSVQEPREQSGAGNSEQLQEVTSSAIPETGANGLSPAECDAEAIPPRRIRDPEPDGIFELFKSGQYREGFCSLEFRILEDGTVADVRVVRPPDADDRLRQVLVGYVQSARYESPTSCGRPTAILSTISINHCPVPLESQNHPG
jgi:hypothetical protein